MGECSEFKGKKPEDCKIPSVSVVECNSVNLNLDVSVISALTLNIRNTVAISTLGCLPSVEMSKTEKCQVHLNGPPDMALKTEILHEMCMDNQFVLPFADKHGDSSRELASRHASKQPLRMPPSWSVRSWKCELGF